MNDSKVYPVDRLVAGYNLILAVTWALLLGRAPYAPLLLFAHVSASFLPRLLAVAPDRPCRLRDGLREIYPIIWVLAFWTEIDFIRAHLHGIANDGPIAALDHALFGAHLSDTWIATMPYVWLSEAMHFCYFAYYPLIFLPPLALMIAGRIQALRDVVLRLAVTYLACFLVYIVFPVDGPHFLQQQYQGPLNDGVFYNLVRGAQALGDSRGAAFPSSHVTAAFSIAYIGWRWFKRPIALLLTAEAVGVALSTVYTQNHYAVDAIAGIDWALTLQGFVVPLFYRWLGPRPLQTPLVPVLPPYPQIFEPRGGIR